MDDRSTYLGGSDVASVLAAPGAYHTPFELWQLKTGARRPTPDNEAMQWGRRLEPMILEQWFERTGRVPVHMLADGEWCVGRTVRHSDYPFLGANLDALGRDGDGLVIVDAKNTQRFGLGRDGQVADVDAGEIPAPWWLQLHHYGWVLGVARGEIAALVNGAELRVLTVDLDLAWYEQAVVPQLVEFWRHVETKTPPPHREFVDVSKRPVSIEAVDACARYAAAAKAARAAEAEKDAARDDVLRALAAAGNPNRAVSGPFKIAASVVSSERIDVAALRAEMPEVAAKYTVTSTPSVSVRITGG